LQEFSPYFSLPRTVVRRLSIVLSCYPKTLHSQ
jgi:hypothetical protein